MDLDTPKSQMQQFEAELVRRFFHPKSYFYLCFSNQIESLTNSESESDATTAVNLINRLVTNLVSAGDAYAEWMQLVRQPGLEELQLLLSGKIIWLSQQSLNGAELKPAIDTIASALFIKILELVRQSESRQVILNFLEGELALNDFVPSDEVQDNPETDEFARLPVQNDITEIFTDDSPTDKTPAYFFDDAPAATPEPEIFATDQIEMDVTPPIEPKLIPESNLGEPEACPVIPTDENQLFSQFRAEAAAVIQTLISKIMAAGEHSVENHFRALQAGLTELNELAMIQGFDILENLSFKLISLIPEAQKSGSRLQRALGEVCEDTLHFMLNWLNGSVSETEIREKFNELRVFAEAIGAGLVEESEPETPMIPGPTPIATDAVTAPELMLPDSGSEDPDTQTPDVAEIIIESVSADVAGFPPANDVFGHDSEDNEPMIEAVPVDETDFAPVDLETEGAPEAVPETENAIQLPGEDDDELKQLINDILTAKIDQSGPGGIFPEDAEPRLSSEPTQRNMGKQFEPKKITEVSETDLFKSEAALYLKIIDDALQNLKEQPHNPTFLEDIELSAYSIKRLAQKMGFELLSRLPEQIEKNMADLARKRRKVSMDIITHISDAITFINNLEKNDVNMKDKLKNILFKLSEHDKELIF